MVEIFIITLVLLDIILNVSSMILSSSAKEEKEKQNKLIQKQNENLWKIQEMDLEVSELIRAQNKMLKEELEIQNKMLKAEKEK